MHFELSPHPSWLTALRRVCAGPFSFAIFFSRMSGPAPGPRISLTRRVRFNV